jgi:hypothetical protein
MPQLAQPPLSRALAQKIPNSGFLNNRRPHDRIPDLWNDDRRRSFNTRRHGAAPGPGHRKAEIRVGVILVNARISRLQRSILFRVNHMNSLRRAARGAKGMSNRLPHQGHILHNLVQQVSKNDING